MPEVRLKIDRHRAVLQILRDDGTTFDPALERGEARGTARDFFDDVYEAINYMTHGLPKAD